MPANKENSGYDLPRLQKRAKTVWAGPGDIPGLTGEMIVAAVPHRDGVAVKRGRPLALRPKQAVSIRLDADALAHYRASGVCWQSRVNAVLRNAAKLDHKS